MLWWVSPFGHPRIKAWEATPRGLSQPPTSFIGSRRQGIHRWLFVAWKNKDARARYGILKGRTTNAARRRRLSSLGRGRRADVPTGGLDRGGPSSWVNRERCSQKTEQRRDRLDAWAVRGRLPKEAWPAKTAFHEEPSS
jgi:hypothetical protein